MKTLLIASGLLILLGAGCARPAAVSSFETCVAAGYPVMESQPRQCRAGGTTYAERLPQAQPAPQSNAELGEAFRLRAGEARAVDGGMRVTLLGIDDSRCKPGQQCIWAGELSARLKLEGPEETAPGQELTLGTLRAQSGEASGFRFFLKEASETSVTLVVTRSAARP
jgi:hypothetical protein